MSKHPVNREPVQSVTGLICSCAMGRIGSLAFVAAVCMLACSGGGGDDESSCGATRTTGLSGEGPTCANRLECGETEWRLECDGINSGTCVCLKNGVEEKTIPYDDAFCPADFGTADFDAHYAAARQACGWP